MTHPLFNTDSYKFSHWNMYPEGTTRVYSYIESRGGTDELMFFGLQMYLKELVRVPLTHADVDAQKALIDAHIGPNVFNEAGFRRIVDEHGGLPPVTIKAVREGTVLAPHNVLVTIVNNDPTMPWLTSFMETHLLQSVWYPTTVASVSYKVKKMFMKGLERSCDTPSSAISFSLNDFGFRGVSSAESAMIGGLAHLVNFLGTDTTAALWAAKTYYDCDMAGYSVMASEHSVSTAYGEDEDTYLDQMISLMKPNAIISVVSDTYDLFGFVEKVIGRKDDIVKTGGIFVVRPDSGDPVDTPIQVLKMLANGVGYTVNEKGYKVLPSSFRIIQGDGMNLESISRLINRMIEEGFSVENIVTGMGGGLLQSCSRDTFRFAQKASAIFKDGEWIGVCKKPKTDPGKNSKKGLLALKYGKEGYQTETVESLNTWDDELRIVYKNGKLFNIQTLDDVRKQSMS